ncbi:MAG: hypothetical protein IIC74_00760 [Bacteroidetes bacterium]|nr:hypothetical protein [Bacteroidota bacterium]
MTSFKEIILSLFEASRERLKNPAIGTFILSWMAINWRFLAILFFSDSSLIDRIRLIENDYLKLDLNLWYPLLVMVIYMLILPNLMAIFDSINQKSISFRKGLSNKNKLDDIIARNKHSLEDVVAQQEIAAEKRQLELIQQGSPDVSKLKQQIEDLKNQNSLLLEKENSETVKTVTNEEDKTSTNSKQISKRPVRKPTTKTKTDESKEVKPLPTSDKYPAMRENVIKNIAKSEKEWILLYGFYSSNFGKKEFTRDQLRDAYKETKRKTRSRQMNISNNIGNLVKHGFIRFLNDEEMLLTDVGRELVKEILNR